MNSEPNTFAKSIKQSNQQLAEWFTSSLGQRVLETELQTLETILPNMFGYHILQIGNLMQTDYLQSSRIQQRVTSILESLENNQTAQQFYCSKKALPIAADSIDVVVLPHILEFNTDPHQVLREMERVLIGEGHVVILGFNPWSFWGIYRSILTWFDKTPWHGKFFSPFRVKDWLSLLDFEIEQSKTIYFRPPIRSKRLNQWTIFMEKLGRYVLPFAGGVYVIIAKKRVATLTPNRMRWKLRRRLISSGVAEPSARRVNE